MNFINLKTAHFIGIKGVQMSALAILMKQRGMTVTGSDVAEEFITDKNLKKHNIPFVEKFDPKNLDYNPDLVVMTPACEDNVEAREAKKRGLKIIYGAELLGLLMDEFEGIVICGTHGKTTTTAMLSYVLEKCGEDPSFLIGTADIFGLGASAKLGKGRYFVAEGDEYKISGKDKRSKFLAMRPKLAIITSIEMDHPDMFSSIQEVVSAFELFFKNNFKKNGFVAACGDDAEVKKVLKNVENIEIENYGFAENNDWQAQDCDYKEESTDFDVFYKKKKIGKFTTQLAGEHSVKNTLAVIAICNKIGLDLEKVKNVLNEFVGSERRLEAKGYINGALAFDDYAHHPTAIATTLDGLKKKFPKRKIWCVFQPHTFSRTKLLLNDFANAFDAADHVLICDIFGSARETIGDVHAKDIVRIGEKVHPDMRYVGSLKNAKRVLSENIIEDDVVITMGAGDVYKIFEK